jgi:Ran GTPase-activating protein (RanGAP) involved in mRNA processing and transport
MSEVPELLCPAVRVPDFEPCAASELEPLLAWLRSDAPLDAVTTFPRGTFMPDGRLDLCKQSLGLDNAERLLDALRGNSRVRSLLLGTDGLRSAGAKRLAAMLSEARPPALETLYLGCNHIEPDGVEALADALAHHAVRALWLKRNPLGPAGARALAELLRVQPGLEVLDLTNTRLGDAGAEAIAAGLLAQVDAPRGLQVLMLGSNGIGVRGCEALGEALARHPHLRELALAVSPLADAGACVLAAGLARSRRLTSLDLASCGIGVAGLAALLDALGPASGLVTLDLGSTPSSRVLGADDNALDDARGGALLGAWLAGPALALARLDVRHAGIRSRGALAIAAGLAHNHALVELQLGKFVARTIKRRIRAELERNRASASPERAATPWHVAAILSVYRTVLDPRIHP